MQFIRLLRPVNLLVILLTMYGMRVFFLPYIDEQRERIIHSEPFDFFLLVFSTMIIAGAGNIINDYFDVKADRINKPDKVIIGKYIKPRWAIVSHWIMNLIAFSIAIYLSYRYRTFWYMFVHLFSINVLWFYSMYFKRRFLIGNVLIALLTALVPILCGIHFIQLVDSSNQVHLPASWNGDLTIGISGDGIKTFFVIVFALFAGGLNLIREIVKDIEDIDGDKLIKAKTLPIVLGMQKSKWIAAGLLLALLLIPIPFLMEGYEAYADRFFISMAPLGFIYILLLINFILLLKSTQKGNFHRVDLILKLAMALGCLFPFYWYFL